jgi:hypothetical protein
MRKAILIVGLASVMTMQMHEPASAIPACGKPSGIGYECYEDSLVNGRTDYGGTKQISGQIQAGQGYVITRTEFINESQFGSVSGPNIKKIQSGASVQISEILSETSRQLEEAYNKATAEYQNVKYMAEAHDRMLKEISARKEAISNVASNVDVVNWDASVSGRCVTSVLGRCVDSIGGKLQGKVRVYKLYIGTRDEVLEFQSSLRKEIELAFKPTPSPSPNTPQTSPPNTSQEAIAGAMSDIVQSCNWAWSRADDSIVAPEVRFVGNGQIIGYSSPNERGWRINQNGELVFIGQTREDLTVFDKAGFRKGKLVLFGRYTAGTDTVTQLTCEGF